MISTHEEHDGRSIITIVDMSHVPDLVAPFGLMDIGFCQQFSPGKLIVELSTSGHCSIAWNKSGKIIYKVIVLRLPGRNEHFRILATTPMMQALRGILSAADISLGIRWEPLRSFEKLQLEE
ncbi:hypothetical protein ABKN59_003517 [Abortiporus biennis]